MNIRQRRLLRGLKAYTVAKELGIDYNTYMEVERGNRALADEYLDKFMNVMANAKEIKLNRLEKIKKMNEEFDNGTMTELAKEMGYTHSELAEKLGLVQGTISNNLRNDPRYISEETRERIYDFLHNPINKKYKKEDLPKKEKKYRKCKARLTPTPKWQYLNDKLNEFEVSRTDFAEKIGCTPEHLSNVISGKRNASEELEERINKNLEEIIRNNDNSSVANENTEIEETNILDKNILDKNVLEEKVMEITPEIEFDTNDLVKENIAEEQAEEQIEGIDLEKERMRKVIDAFIKLIEKI